MNMNEGGTGEELKALLIRAKDDEGHHVIWISRDGEVNVTRLPDDINPAGFEDRFPSCLIRYETAIQGNGYVGSKAAEDPKYVQRLLTAFHRDWGLYEGAEESTYIDYF